MLQQYHPGIGKAINPFALHAFRKKRKRTTACADILYFKINGVPKGTCKVSLFV
jgi:hypothetical protein